MVQACRITRSNTWRLWSALAAVLLLSAAAVGQPQAGLAVRAESAARTLKSSQATPAQRDDAARALLAMADQESVRSALQGYIAGPLTPESRAIFAALAAGGTSPPRLFPFLAQRLAVATPEELPVILPVFAGYRSRDSVLLLGRYLLPASPDPAAQAAITALTRLSARDDIPPTREAWLAFTRDVASLSDNQWRQSLVSAISLRERRLESQRQRAVTELIEALRKLHLASKVEDRPEFLASLLHSGLPEVRDLGFELVSRELSANGVVDGPVGLVALELLHDPEPAVRANAAVLVRQLAPPGAAQAVADALSAETDAAAAKDLLLAAARWPSSATAAAVVRWLQPERPVFNAAIEAAWWVFRAGQLPAAQAAEIIDALRATPGERLSGPGIWLLANLGQDEDRDRLVPLLQSESGVARQAVSEALLWYPEYTDAILQGAEHDPDLFNYAAQAVLVNEPTEEGVARLLDLPHAPGALPPTFFQAANGLPADQLFDIARQATDVPTRRSLLELLTEPTRLMSEKANPKLLGAISQGVLELADMDLTDRQPEAALTLLDAAPFAETLAEPQRLASLRCAALLGLGRLEAAAGIRAPVDAWMRGLQIGRKLSVAPQIVKEIEQRFATDMTPEQQAALAEIKSALPPIAETPKADLAPAGPG